MLLAAYLDGELSPGELVAFEARLADESALRRDCEDLAALSGAVRRSLAETPVPAGLGARLAEGLGAAEPVPPRQVPRWLPLAAVLLIGLFAGGLLGYGAGLRHEAGGGLSAEGAAIDAIYAGHLRGLAAPQPFDIASSDRHVVKPWFNGRTVIAPDAPDLAPEGFPLAGGRVDVVGGEKVPTLVYRRREHVISVTILPRRDEAEAAPPRRAGSTIERWDVGDLSYFAVSDLNAVELRQFAQLFRARTAPAG
ncbi:membrane protein [Aureimonas endophytica]|uniref:Membrane protein n=1 Tax=Aureimonas endophytica TaxID=2027858 RepID=A0A917E8Z7_9HYPH|nr:membrane protein [Aureimonas endophytica]